MTHNMSVKKVDDHDDEADDKDKLGESLQIMMNWVIYQGSLRPGFVNRVWDWDIFPSGPINETGTGNSIIVVSLLGPESGMVDSQSHY